MDDLIIDKNEGIIFKDDPEDGGCQIFIDGEFVFRLYRTGAIKLKDWLTEKNAIEGMKLAAKNTRSS